MRRHAGKLDSDVNSALFNSKYEYLLHKVHLRQQYFTVKFTTKYSDKCAYFVLFDFNKFRDQVLGAEDGKRALISVKTVLTTGIILVTQDIHKMSAASSSEATTSSSLSSLTPSTFRKEPQLSALSGDVSEASPPLSSKSNDEDILKEVVSLILRIKKKNLQSSNCHFLLLML